MPSIMTLGDGGKRASSLGAEKCKCVFNPRTKQRFKLCFVGKSKKNRSGWAFQGKCR